jgi:hypothetical protein
MHAAKKYQVRKEARMEFRLRMQRGGGVAGSGVGLRASVASYGYFLVHRFL